jgi:taurine--2-oxoglutarate transaminase
MPDDLTNLDSPMSVADENRRHVIFPWTKQAGLKPKEIVRAEGVHVWDGSGKRYLDLAAQLACVNAGHQHPRIVHAIQEQAAKLCYAAPQYATEVRGRLARMIAEVMPGDLNKIYFTSAGAEANEYAVKIARTVTRRPKIIARYRAYHGATHGAMSLTGDWRRAYNEPGMPGTVHAFQPYCYRCTFGQEPGSCARECLSSLEEIIQFENPDFVAAVIVETITGPSNGLYVPPDDYMPKLRALCDKYGIMLICDEVMSGWGRTGEWFAVNNWNVVPDIITTAKGLTNSQVPLGAVAVSARIAEALEEQTLWAGSTYSGHALACAAGIAAIETYREEGLIENSRRLGAVLLAELERIRQRHPTVGDVRGRGLFAAIELVKDRGTRTPLMPAREEPYATRGGLGAIKRALDEEGVMVFTRPNLIGISPPLTITEEQLVEGLAALDRALDHTDAMLTESTNG